MKIFYYIFIIHSLQNSKKNVNQYIKNDDVHKKVYIRKQCIKANQLTNISKMEQEDLK